MCNHSPAPFNYKYAFRAYTHLRGCGTHSEGRRPFPVYTLRARASYNLGCLACLYETVPTAKVETVSDPETGELIYAVWTGELEGPNYDDFDPLTPLEKRESEGD